MTDGDVIVIDSDDGHCTKRSRWVSTAWALLIVVKRHTQLASTALVGTLMWIWFVLRCLISSAEVSSVTPPTSNVTVHSCCVVPTICNFFRNSRFWYGSTQNLLSSSTVEKPGSKKVPRPSYGLKIVHGSPLSQFTIFRETERFARTYLNV